MKFDFNGRTYYIQFEYGGSKIRPKTICKLVEKGSLEFPKSPNEVLAEAFVRVSAQDGIAFQLARMCRKQIRERGRRKALAKTLRMATAEDQFDLIADHDFGPDQRRKFRVEAFKAYEGRKGLVLRDCIAYSNRKMVMDGGEVAKTPDFFAALAAQEDEEDSLG